MAGLAPRLPLRRDERDGHELIKTFEGLVQQNLKMLILTNPGERMMDPEFGVGLKRFLFEQNNAITQGDIQGKIFQQVGVYLPFIKILNINFKVADSNEHSDNFLRVRIEYFVVPLQLKAKIDIVSEFSLDSLDL